MIIKNLLNEILSNEKLSLAFCMTGDLVDLPDLGIQWICQMRYQIKDYFIALGFSNNKFYVLDINNGVLNELDESFIVDFPFNLIDSPLDVSCNYVWSNLDVIEAYLCYLDYCKLNNINIDVGYYAWGEALVVLLNKLKASSVADLKLIKDTLANDLRISQVFDCIAVDDGIKDGFFPDVLSCAEFNGECNLLEATDWLFLTSHSMFTLVGVFNNVVWFIDSEGYTGCANCDIYNLPFLLAFNPFTDDDWFLNDLSRVDNFLYYFSYCEKNRILLLPENYAWKSKLQEIKRSVRG